MPALIHPHASHPPPASAPERYCDPHYECEDQPRGLKISVYLPGVEAAGVEIATSDTDLVVTARKSHLLRVNWQAAHLEAVQRDYQLRLRLGAAFDFEKLHASLDEETLVLTLPRRPASLDSRRADPGGSPERRVA